MYDCCEHCEHPPREYASDADWQLWHARPCESVDCATGILLRGTDA